MTKKVSTFAVPKRGSRKTKNQKRILINTKHRKSKQLLKAVNKIKVHCDSVIDKFF
jgi:hypothetical protein